MKGHARRSAMNKVKHTEAFRKKPGQVPVTLSFAQVLHQGFQAMCVGNVFKVSIRDDLIFRLIDHKLVQ